MKFLEFFSCVVVLDGLNVKKFVLCKWFVILMVKGVLGFMIIKLMVFLFVKFMILVLFLMLKFVYLVI